MDKMEISYLLDDIYYQASRMKDCLEVLDNMTDDMNVPLSKNAKSLIALLLQTAEANERKMMEITETFAKG